MANWPIGFFGGLLLSRKLIILKNLRIYYWGLNVNGIPNPKVG
jgi:hypothetical protein